MGCDSRVHRGTQCDFISIHAPAWGATRWRLTNTNEQEISIHAPAWGATRSKITTAIFLIYFNPRTRMGCDASRPLPPPLPLAFQSTHPHGVRHLEALCQDCHNKISIHAPAWGATAVASNSFPINSISIHAPAWGATSSETSALNIRLNFNPRTRMGCDMSEFKYYSELYDFNPRTRMGCDIEAIMLEMFYAYFNPRTRMGCDKAKSTV